MEAAMFLFPSSFAHLCPAFNEVARADGPYGTSSFKFDIDHKAAGSRDTSCIPPRDSGIISIHPRLVYERSLSLANDGDQKYNNSTVGLGLYLSATVLS